MNINIIVAYCKNNGIGFENKMPWHIKSDLKKFQKLTIGNGNNAIIMGKNTYNSILNINIKLNLIGHAMASDIVIRASEKQNISSIAAISPYSTKVTENFPKDLLLTSGQFEKHLRNHS